MELGKKIAVHSDHVCNCGNGKLVTSQIPIYSKLWAERNVKVDKALAEM